MDLEKEDEEQKILDICEQMIKPLDGPERIITNVYRYKKKLDYLCNLIALALANPNPLTSIRCCRLL